MKHILTLILTLCFALCQAHTIWLETSHQGKIGHSHHIKIFFGEMGQPTFTEKWFSDLALIQVQLTTPSGKQEKLTTSTEQAFLSTYFTPQEKGIYKVEAIHLVKDVFKGMKIRYQAVGFVAVGVKKLQNAIHLGDAPLQIQTNQLFFKTKEKQLFHLFKEQAIAPKIQLKITAHNGWSIHAHGNIRGEASFTPLWKGYYLLEYAHKEEEQGTHNGQAYHTYFQNITLAIKVK